MANLVRRVLNRLSGVNAVNARLPLSEIPDTLDLTPSGGSDAAAQAPASTDALYLGFENVFRGTQEEIARRQSAYVEWARVAFKATGAKLPFLDVGAGRGEFVGLLGEAGILTVGIDVNEEDVRLLREKGLDAERADANSYLATLPDRSLSGISANSVIEHLTPEYLESFLRLAADKIAPGGCIALETNNPENWFALGNFWLDLTHVRPYHAQTVAYLLTQHGFTDVFIRYTSPAPVASRLPDNSAANYLEYVVVGTRSTAAQQ